MQNGDDIWPNLRRFVNEFMKVGLPFFTVTFFTVFKMCRHRLNVVSVSSNYLPMLGKNKYIDLIANRSKQILNFLFRYHHTSSIPLLRACISSFRLNTVHAFLYALYSILFYIFHLFVFSYFFNSWFAIFIATYNNGT